MAGKLNLSLSQKLRNSFLLVHRWVGLCTGIIVFIVAITGCIYVFEEELRATCQSRYFHVPVPERASKESLEGISALVKKKFPKETITQIRFDESAHATIIYYTKSRRAISVDPYTKEVTGVRNLDTDFLSWILVMHRTLHLGEVGKQIVKWNVLLFFVMCVSGLILWWPKQKRFLKQAMTLHPRAKNWKRLNWDLHSVLGFYSLLVLFIIAMTGIFWTFDWAKQLVSFTTGPVIKKTKVPINKGDSILKVYTMERAYYKAKQMYPGAVETILTNPEGGKQPLRVLFRYPYAIMRKQNALYFDKYSGELLHVDLYQNSNAYDAVLRSNYSLHTGNIPLLGIGSKIIYFLASLFAASLPITGFLMWWGRRKKSKQKTKIVSQKRTGVVYG